MLLQPPPGDLTGPYPALCYLKSFAAANGYSVRVRDLGIEAFVFLSQKERLQDIAARIADEIQELEAREFLTPDQQDHYRRLLMSAGFGLVRDFSSQISGCFKNPDRFADYHDYQKTCRLLDAFFRMLGAVHYPTEVTPSEYPTATMLKTMPRILSHRRPDINPFMAYYEEKLFPQIAAANPLVVGISMVFAAQSIQALVLGNLLKERFPDIHVTMGGAYLSQWVMGMADTQLDELFRCTDSVVCGEGEGPLTELLRRTENGQGLDGVPNLIGPRDGARGYGRPDELTYTDVSAQPPPDFSDLDLSAYLTPETILPYSISRGCYWGKCVFCQNRYGDHRMRRYQTVPVEKAISDMTRLSEQYGTRHFNFSNDVIDPAYLKAFSRAVITAGKKFVWNTDLRAEQAFDPETCRLMAKAGLNCVAIGLESGSQKTLDAMEKGNRVATTRNVLKNLYDAGIATQAMGIFGFPGETEADGEQTVAFLEANVDRISYYVMGLLMVVPGSRMHQEPHAHGVTSISYANNPLKTPEPVWTATTRMSVDAVHRLYERLKQMESLYAIDEYPYVGGLSTNHGFLYFRFGPDILKRLRQAEKQRHDHTHTIVGIDPHHRTTRGVQPVVPRLAMPYMFHRSPFPVERIPGGPASAGDRMFPSSGMPGQYLVDPVNYPVRIGDIEKRLIGRIDGRRNLRTVLKKHAAETPRRLRYFLLYLFNSGLVVVKGEGKTK